MDQLLERIVQTAPGLLRDATTLKHIGFDQAALRLAAAALLGGIIGIERELRARPAGLRTHMMVALAAALFTLVGFELLELPASDRDGLRFDPLRLIEAITAGVAFLAAGSILVRGGDVKGLTTGASLWLSGAVGLACARGHLGLALLAVGMTVVILIGVRLFAMLIPDRDVLKDDPAKD